MMESMICLSPKHYENVYKCKISILNRWGNVIFEDDKIDFEWNGTNFQNEPCSEGVYFYILETTNECEVSFKEHGSISLIR